MQCILNSEKAFPERNGPTGFAEKYDGYQAKASVVYAAVNLKNPAATARTATMTPEAKTPLPRPHVTSLLIGSVRAFNQSMAV